MGIVFIGGRASSHSLCAMTTPEELALQFQTISLMESEQQAVIKQQNK
ncbi:hypothetical protein AB7W30_23070 [Providencia manganoxydans]|nr:hypothetical protein [Providencia sp. PROV266]